MERTPSGTPVGVDDPYAHVERCDHLTDDGRCRFAAEHAGRDPAFAHERRAEGLRCPVVDTGEDLDWDWRDCPHFRSRAAAGDRTCTRCGLTERRLAHSTDRPLLEEHHLSYAGEESTSHVITVVLCRWCHARVHQSWARIDDDAVPDTDAIAELEGRRAREQEECEFESAAERYIGE